MVPVIGNWSMSQFHRGRGYCHDPLAGVPLPSDAQSYLVLDTMADLREYDFSRVADGQMFWIKGYYAISDGGGGAFSFHRSESEEDNGGTVIVPDDAVGWLQRVLFSSPISVKFFGAKGDGNHDDTEAIQATIDFATGSEIFFPVTSAYYKITAGLVISSNTALIGEVPRVTGEDPNTAGVQIRTSTADLAMISTAAGNVFGLLIANLGLYGDGLTTRAIVIGTANLANLAYDNIIQNVSVRACRSGIVMNRSVRSEIRDVRLNGADLPNGTGLNFFFSQGCNVTNLYVADYEVCVNVNGQGCNFYDCNISLALGSDTSGVNLLILNQAYHNNFYNCVFENLGTGSGAIKEVLIYQAAADMINTVDNSFYNCTWNGLVAASTHVEIGSAASPATKNTRFINCTFSDLVTTNILLTNASGTSFQDSYRINGYDGDEIARPVISGTDANLRFNDQVGIQLPGAIQILSGAGDPDGVVAAAVGSTFQRTDGGASTAFYVKETGAATSSGWVGK